MNIKLLKFRFFLGTLMVFTTISQFSFSQALTPKRGTLNTGSQTSIKRLSNAKEKLAFAHLKNEIIIKIKKEYLANCDLNSINIDGFSKLTKSLPKHAVSAKYPLENSRFNKGKNHIQLANNPLEGIYHMKFSSEIDIEKTLAELNALPFVQYAEPIKLYEPLYRPNDPLADSLLADSVLSGKINYHIGHPNQYHLAAIHAYDAWDITKGDTNVLIGVIDVAYDTTNIEIRGNIKFNNADPVDGIDNDGNGYTDDYWGWNTANGTGNIHEAPTGHTVHGSQVAGVIGASTDNGIGTAGIGFKCKIVPVKCWNGFGLQSTYDGIYYCVKRKCKVINCSWGGAGTPQQSEQDIINFAVANGSIIVAAAGNGTGQFYTEANFYPASYKNVLSIAQCLPDGTSFLAGPVNAVTYSRNVDLVAPSIDIFTTLCGDHGETGSSLASPIVSGTAGLVWSRFPQLTPQQVMERLRVSSDYKDSIPANDSLREKMGYGMVNAYRAVTDTTLKAVRWDNDSIQNTFLGDPGYAFAGDTLRLSANFINYLSPTSNLVAKISTTSPYLIVLDSTTNLGSMGTLESKWNSRDPFKIYILPGSPNYFSAQIRIGFSDGTYRDYQYINLDNLNPIKVYPSYYDMDINQITLSIMNNGRFAFNDADANQSPSIGSGYKFQSIYHRTWEMGLLLGTSASKVSDCIRGAQNASNQQLKDTDLNASIPISKTTTSIDKTITVTFSDSMAANPIGLKVQQKTYALKNAPDDKYIIVEYTITNNSGTTIDSLCGGIFSDWSVYNGVKFRSQWDPAIMTGVVGASSGIPYYDGLQVLYPTTKPAQAIFNYSAPSNGIDITDGFTESEKFNFMSKGILNQSAGLTNSGVYMASYVGTTLYNLLPGSKRTMAFAVVNGLTYTDISNSAKSAKNKFISLRQGPKPIIDSLFIVCKGQPVVFRPLGGTKFIVYDTVPGIRPAIASNISSYSISGVNTKKTYYITNNDSIFESKFQKVTVDYSRVKAAFNYSMSHLKRLTADFTTTTPGSSWKWNLGGSTASGIQVSKTYSNAGTFPVKLTIIDPVGCKDSITANASIILLPESPKPIIDSQFIVCKRQSTILKPLGGTKFNFYDTIPGIRAALASNTSTFTTSGINTLNVIYITNTDSIFESVPQKVLLDYSKNKAAYTYSISTVTRLTANFQGTPSGKTWSWNFGNGITASGINTSKTFYSTGHFPIQLIISDSIGCRDSLSSQVLISLPQAPKPLIDSLLYTCKGQSIIISPWGGTQYNFYDTLPGIRPPLVASVSTFTTPSINGPVTYYVTNTDSVFESDAQKVIVDISKIKAEFAYSISPVSPLTVDLVSTLTGDSFHWNLGDGNTATGSNLSHTYPNSGTFPVKLKAIDQIGCSDTVQMPVVIPLTTELATNPTEAFIVLPNPATDYIKIVSTATNPSNSEVSLVNPLGQVVHQELAIFGEKSFLSIPVSHLPSGVYLLNLGSGQNKSTKKISIVR